MVLPRILFAVKLIKLELLELLKAIVTPTLACVLSVPVTFYIKAKFISETSSFLIIPLLMTIIVLLHVSIFLLFRKSLFEEMYRLFAAKQGQARFLL